MNRLSASFWLIALLGAAVLAALWFRAERRLRQTAAELVAARHAAADLRSQLTAAGERNAALDRRIGQLESDLATTHAELATANENASRLSRELTQTAAELAAGHEMRRTMERHLAGLERELAAARAALVPAETIEGYRTTIAALERKLAEANAGAAAPGTPGASTAAFTTRPSLTANVLSVGPSNSFVVLDYGSERGAVIGQRLMINRGTETAAEVLISDVRPQLSIAQVQPDSLRGVLHKGDSAVLTH